MKIEQVCASLKEYFSQNKIVSLLMPIRLIGMLVCAGLKVLDFFISLGGVVTSLSFFGFVLFALLVFADCQFKLLAGGLALYASSYLLSVIRSIFRGVMPWSSLIHLLVYLGIAFLAFRKSGGTVDDLKEMAKKGVQTASEKVSVVTKTVEQSVSAAKEAPVADASAVEVPTTEENDAPQA